MPEPATKSPVEMLLEIARVVWPGRIVALADMRHCVFVDIGGGLQDFAPNSLDTIRRILLACTPEQRDACGIEIIKSCGNSRDLTVVLALTTDPATILIPALHRAICK